MKITQVDFELESSQLGKNLVDTLGYCNEGYEN